jgi:hypothetical protein
MIRKSCRILEDLLGIIVRVSSVGFYVSGTTFSDAFKNDIGTARQLENFALGEMLVLPQTFGLVLL